jgi:hypothetical protein
MHVVRHEAVRNDGKPCVACTSQYLLEHEIDVFAHDEVTTPVICAERQEIPVQAGVVERLEVSWVAGQHDQVPAISEPRSAYEITVRLKPDITYDSRL